MQKDAIEVDAVALVPRYELPAEPSWDRARELIAEIRQTVRAIVLLGLEIRALRTQFFAQGAGGGGDRKSLARRGEITSSGAGRSDEKGWQYGSSGAGRTDEKGWQETIERELGISKQTALRLMEKAQYTAMLDDVTRGEQVQYKDTRNQNRTIQPTDEMKQMAFTFLESVVAGTVNAKRAWAGLMGEGQRRAKGGGLHRSEVDYRRTMRSAAVTLQSAFVEWPRLDWDGMEAEEHRAAEAVVAMLHALPEQFRAAMASIVAEEWPAGERAALEADLGAAGRNGRKGRA